MSSDAKWLIALLAFTALIFLNSLGNPFVWEDKPLILENRYIKNPRYSGNFFSPSYWRSSHPLQPRYRPIRLLTFSLDYKFWGYSPFGYHLTNLAIHSANVALLYLLGLALFKSRFIALSSAFFFAAHPAHVESVTYIKNRTDLLSMLFYLLAALLYFKALPRSSNDAPGAGKSIRYLSFAASLIFFLLALLSKEMAISLPLILIIYIFLLRDDPLLAKVKYLIAIIPFVLIGAFLLKFMAEIASNGGLQHALLPQIAPSARLGIILKTYLYYFKILLLPNNLNADTTFLLPKSFFQLEPLAMALGLVGLVLALLATLNNRRGAIFALGWTLLALLPVANIAIIYGRPVGEQRAYIPSGGFAFLLGLILHEIWRRREGEIRGKFFGKCAPAMAAAIVLFYSGTTLQRNTVWKDDLVLWTDTVAKSPRLGRVHHNLADAYKEKGLIDEALKEYKTSLAIDPNYDNSHYNLGNLYKDVGSTDRAVAQYKMALNLKPLSAKSYNNLGTSYISKGFIDSAIEQFKKALEIAPDLDEARNNLGLAYQQKGMVEQAAKELRNALRIDPTMAEPHLNLGSLYASDSLLDKSMTEYKIALASNPLMERAYLGLAALYREKRLHRRSITLIERAKMFGATSPAFLLSLAGALRDSFHNDKAIYQYLSLFGRDGSDLDKAYLGLGLTFKQIGALDKAIDFIIKALRMSQSWAEPRNVLGVLFFKKRLSDKAALEFLTSAQIDPSIADARHNLGLLMSKLGRFDRAAVEYLLAITIDDSYGDAYLNLGNIYQRRGLGLIARKIYHSGLAKKPDSALLHKAMGLLFLNVLNEPGTAARHLKRSLELDPGQAEAAPLRAMINGIKSQSAPGD